MSVFSVREGPTPIFAFFFSLSQVSQVGCIFVKYIFGGICFSTTKKHGSGKIFFFFFFFREKKSSSPEKKKKKKIFGRKKKREKI